VVLRVSMTHELVGEAVGSSLGQVKTHRRRVVGLLGRLIAVNWRSLRECAALHLVRRSD
jgi:hypothetical protein